MAGMDSKTLTNLRDRKAQQSPGRRRARKHARSTDGKPVIGAFKHGSRRLYVIRESAEYAWMLMVKMIEQTLWPYRADPTVEAALQHSVTPLTKTEDGLRLRAQLGVRALHSRGSRSKELGVLFRIGEDRFLYALTSAGKSTYEGDNEFTTVLSDILREVRPAELVSGPFSRLARRMDLAAQVLPVLKDGRTTVFTYETPSGMDLTTAGGEAQWDALAKAAEWDYRATLTRLLTGVVYELKNNRFPRAALSLPPGYVKDDGTHRNAVILDPAARATVRSLIELAASDKQEVEIADELAKLGMTSRQPGHVKSGKALPVNEVAQPARLVSVLFEHLPVYLDGTYRFQHEMTIPHLDEFHGLPVHRHAPEDYGYITVDLKFGMPDGGWHDREVIEAAISKRLIEPVTSPRAPHNRDIVKPLASIGQWIEGGYEYVLHASDEAVYLLRRRPLSEAFDDNGKRLAFDDNRHEIIGRFYADQLHATYAAALESIEDGVMSDLPCPEREATGEQIEELRVRVAEAETAAARAREEVLKATDDDSRKKYRELAEDNQRAAAALRSDLVELERTPPEETLQLLDSEQIAAAIAVLKATDDRTNVEVNRLLRRLTRRFTMNAAACEPIAKLRLEVTARTGDGALTLGPMTALVTNHAVGVGPNQPGWAPAHARRNHRLVELLLLGEGDPDEVDTIWRGENFDSRAYRRRMHEALRDVVPTSQALSALVDCPILDLRRAVLGPMLKTDLEHGLPEPLAAEALRIYNDKKFWWSKGWCPGGMTRQRSLLRFLDKYASDPNEGLEASVVRERLGLDYATLYACLYDSAAKPSYHRSSTPTYRVIEDVGGWLSRPRSRSVPHPVRILACPHCGQRSLTQPLKVPEVPGHLLCRNCRRDRTTGWEYPDDYFLPWDGPQTLPRRQGVAPTNGGRFAPSRNGRIIVGSDLYDPPLPSLHAPSRIRKP